MYRYRRFAGAPSNLSDGLKGLCGAPIGAGRAGTRRAEITRSLFPSVGAEKEKSQRKG
ncbi:hypothetical protein GCWU000246_00119 [Jonquetella anthropi E3_33 E1]|nr:hypothetical protein GCWU000246_00119 [Jonquetella anthropi E3_33 E1]